MIQSDPRRILLVFDQYAMGGFETNLDITIERLYAAGWAVCCAGGSDFSRSPSAQYVQKSEQIDLVPSTAAALSATVARLISEIDTHAIEVVHAHPYLALVPAALAAAATGRPLVVTFHATPLLDQLSEHLGLFQFQLLQNFALPSAAAITAVSELAAANAGRAFQFDSARAAVVLNPIRLEAFPPSPAPEAKSGLLVSRLDPDKLVSCRAVLELFAALQRRDSSWTFSVAGDGVSAEQLRDYAGSLGLVGVEWLGACVDVGAVMARHCFVAGLGRVALEALACARPVVLSDRLGLAGVVTADNFETFARTNFIAAGLPPAMPGQVAAQLEPLLAGGQSARLREMLAARYGAAQVVDSLCSVYREAAAAPMAQDGKARAQDVLGWLERHPAAGLRDVAWVTENDDLPQALFGAPQQRYALRRLRLDTLSEESRHYIKLQDVQRGEIRQWEERTAGLGARMEEAARQGKHREAALAGQIESLLSQKQLQRATIDSIAAQLDEQRQRIEAAEARAAEAIERSSRDLAEQAGRHEREHSLLQSRLAGLLQEKDALAARADGLQSSLARLHSGVETFRRDFASRLAAYRTQRAWKVMLAFRAAYTWIFRRDTSAATLDRFELEFPDVQDYLAWSGDEPPSAPPATLAQRRHDLIVLPIFDFEFRYQRPQQIAAEYARAGHRVFWVSPSRSLPPSSPAPFELIPLRNNLFEVRLRRPPFNLYTEELPEATLAAFSESLDSLVRDRALAAPAVFVQFPSWRRVALGLRALHQSPVIYDCMDDWRNWPVEPKPSRFSIAEEDLLAAECDVLAVSSARFLDRYAHNKPEPVLVPNAADFDFFSSCQTRQGLLPHIPGPIIGYYGAISQWFDTGLIAETARLRPNYSFVLIGQVHDRDVSALQALANVHLLGEKHYSQLPALLREFDAALIPFVIDRLTEAVDPVKIYEYFSQGVAVVSTPLPELERHRGIVNFARQAGDFALAIDKALAEKDPGLRQSRIRYARENRWRDRYETLDRTLTTALPLVSIVVVAYNSAEYLVPFVDSIFRNTTYPNFELILWDNASQDGSAAILGQLESRDARLKVHISGTNHGFAGGNNRAAALARGDYLVILNPDTLVTAGWIERLMAALRSGARVGLSAPVTNFSGNETRIDVSYRDQRGMEEFAQALASDRFGQALPLSCAPLLCALMRTSVWTELNGLDERFEVGMFEDDDFSLRLTRAGYSIVTAEDCFIHHFGNGSFAKLDSESSTAIFEENRRRFESKWGRAWTPHVSRPGASPLAGSQRVPVELFVQQPGPVPAAALLPAPSIARLCPSVCQAGSSVNQQPDGSSALVVECLNATPGTVILWDDMPLSTSFGSATLLSAILPPNFSGAPGDIQVCLANDFGRSEPALFQVQPPWN